MSKALYFRLANFGKEKSGAKARVALRKLSVCVCRASGSVNSFKTQTASSDDIERFRDADRNWKPRFFCLAYLKASLK